MAPRFKEPMYKACSTPGGAEAIIGFPSGIDDAAFDLRNLIVENILGSTDYFLQKSESEPTPVDSWLRFFDTDDKARVQAHISMSAPGLLSKVFNKRRWEEYQRERAFVDDHCKFEMETSHDHPCLIISSRIHTKEQLQTIIEVMGIKMNLIFSRNEKLPPVAQVVMSNRSFLLQD